MTDRLIVRPGYIIRKQFQYIKETLFLQYILKNLVIKVLRLNSCKSIIYIYLINIIKVKLS